MESQNVRFLEFEKPIYDIESKIETLRRGGGGSEEMQRLQKRLEQLEQDIYGNLSPWEQVQLARHPMRPTMKRYVELICDEFIELHGDRRFGDDTAIIGGLARIGGRRLVIVGHEKGGSTRRN